MAASSHKKNIRLSNPLQSAYRKHHSTESALLKVQNDINIRMDKGEVTALTLISTPLTMLHNLRDFQIGMEYLWWDGEPLAPKVPVSDRRSL